MQRFVFLGILATLPLTSQPIPKVTDFNNNGWFSYSGDHRVSGRWGVHFDAQWRRFNVVTRWQQYQARPGVNFALTPNVLLTAGYVFTRAYPYGDYPVPAAFPEHRTYQQALIRHPREGVRFSQRFRIEQRFIKYPNTPDQSWTYQNRFRYMLRADIPLTKTTEGRADWYLPVWDEIFLAIPPNQGARAFDHNRIFVGIGKSLGAPGNLELGYMNQFLGQRNGRIFESNSTLFVTFTSTFDLTNLWEKR